MLESDIEYIVDYFLDSDIEFLKAMGADKTKLPERKEWIQLLESECGKPYEEKKFYYIVWLLNNRPVGHSNINKIQFGKSATMHLHLWENQERKKGLGETFLKQSLPFFFKNIKLEKLLCEPLAGNPAPNKLLIKLGFDYIKTYETTPGWINFLQTVNSYELCKENFTQ